MSEQVIKEMEPPQQPRKQTSHYRQQLLSHLCETFRGRIDAEVVELVLIDTGWKGDQAVDTLFTLMDDVCYSGNDGLNIATTRHIVNQFDDCVDNVEDDADNGAGPSVIPSSNSNTNNNVSRSQTETSSEVPASPYVHRTNGDWPDIALPEHEVRERIITSADRNTNSSNSYNDVDEISAELASDNDISEVKNPKHDNLHENISEKQSIHDNIVRLLSEHDMNELQKDDQRELCNGVDDRSCDLAISNTLHDFDLPKNFALASQQSVGKSEDDFSLLSDTTRTTSAGSLSMYDITSTTSAGSLSMYDITSTTSAGSLLMYDITSTTSAGSLSMYDISSTTSAGSLSMYDITTPSTTSSLFSMCGSTSTHNEDIGRSMSFEIISESFPSDSKSKNVGSLSFENIPDSMATVNVNMSGEKLSPGHDNGLPMDLASASDLSVSNCAHQIVQSSKLSANSKEFIPHGFPGQDTAQNAVDKPHYLRSQSLEDAMFVMPVVKNTPHRDSPTPPQSPMHRYAAPPPGYPAPIRTPNTYTASQRPPHRYPAPQRPPPGYPLPQSTPSAYAGPFGDGALRGTSQRYATPQRHPSGDGAPRGTSQRYATPQRPPSGDGAPRGTSQRYATPQRPPSGDGAPRGTSQKYAIPQRRPSEDGALRGTSWRYAASQRPPSRDPALQSTPQTYLAPHSIQPPRYTQAQNTSHSSQTRNSLSSQQFQSNIDVMSLSQGSMSFEILDAGMLSSSPSSLSSASVSSSTTGSPSKQKYHPSSPVASSPSKTNATAESDGFVAQSKSNQKQHHQNYHSEYNTYHPQSKPLPQHMTFSDALQHSLQNYGSSNNSPPRRPRRNMNVRRRNNEKLESLLACDKRVMVILRGCAGSGKSYLAQELGELGEGVILTSDDYFMQGQDYDYERALVGDAHAWNRQRCEQAVKDNVNPIIIDNTNTQRWEMKPYVLLALEHGYHVELMEPDTLWKFKARELAKRNIHNVPLESIQRMLRRYEHHMTVEKIVGEKTMKALMEERMSRLTDSSQNRTSQEHSDSHVRTSRAHSNDDNGDDNDDDDHDNKDDTDDDNDDEDNSDDDAKDDNSSDGDSRSSDDIIILEEFEEDINDDLEADDAPNEAQVAKGTDTTSPDTDHQDNGSSSVNQSQSIDESTFKILQLNDVVSEDSHDTERLDSNQTTATFDHVENSGNEILQMSLETKPNSNHDVKKVPCDTELDEDFGSFVNCELENVEVSVTTSLASVSSSALFSISQNYCESPERKVASLVCLSYLDASHQDESFEFVSTGNKNVKTEKSATNRKPGTSDWSTLEQELVWETPASGCHGDSSEEFAASDGGENKLNKETEMLNLKKQYSCDRMPEFARDRPSSESVMNTSTCHKNDDVMIAGGKHGVLHSEDPKPQRTVEKKSDKVGKYISAESMNVNSNKKKSKSKGAIKSKLSKHTTMKNHSERKSEESFFDEAVLEKFMSTKWEMPAVPKHPISNSFGLHVSLCKHSDITEANFTDCSTNTVPLDFNILHFLNQGVVLSQCEIYFTVITGNSENFIPVPKSEERILLRVCRDMSTSTDDLEDVSESSKLEFVRSCFPDVPTEDLNAILISCHSDVDWAMNIMLDWGYDYVVSPDEKQKIAVNHLRASETDIGDESVPVSSSLSPRMLCYTSNIGQILSLTELCAIALASDSVLNESKIQDCLIQSGQKRLDALENLTLTRQLSLRSSHVDKQESVEDDIAGGETSDRGQYESLYSPDTAGEPVFISQEDTTTIPDILPDSETTATKTTGDIAHEPSDDLDEEPALSLSLPKRTVAQLVQLFGPLPQPIKAGISMDIDYGTAWKLYKCMQRADIKRQQKEQTLSDAALARKLQEQEYKHSQNDHVTTLDLPDSGGSKSARGNSLREIMDEQLAVQKSREDQYVVMEKNGDVGALSSKMKREKLLHMFPGVDERAIEEVFEANHYSLENTVKAIQAAVHGPDATLLDTSIQAGEHEAQLLSVLASQTAAGDYNGSLIPRTEDKRLPDIQQDTGKEIIQASETDGSPDYQDFRAEAFTHHRLRQECFQKAQEAYRRGMKQVALFYSQQGHLHSVKLREANERASERILEHRNYDLDRSSVLDFHGLHANEAISLLEKLIIQRETEYQLCPDNKPLHLTVITGRGAHSQGGVAKLRPAIMKYLKTSHYNFTEPQPGVIKISLKYR